MLKIVVVDDSAEGRNQLVDRLQRLLELTKSELEILPRIDFKPLSLQELKFHDPADVCVIGPGIVRGTLPEVGTVRRLLPETALMAALSVETSGFSTLEQLARLGIDDTLLPETLPAEFLRKIVLLARRAKRSKPGKLILVDSGKGGLGGTSLCAAMAEAMALQGKRVVVFDFDCQTQDLSRFLQARPFVNENLHLLLEQQRPVTQEFVEQCMVRLWDQGKGSLSCIAPIEENDELFSATSGYSRGLLSILEVLDASCDCVFVDIAGARSAILRTFYRVADKVVYIVGNDPASLYASVDRIAQVRTLLSAEAEIVLTLNNPSARGLSRSFLVEELDRALGLTPENWSATPIPYSSAGQRWPGSGSTLYSLGSSSLRCAIDSLLGRLALIPRPAMGTENSLTFGTDWIRRLLKRGEKIASHAAESAPRHGLAEPQLKLPEPPQGRLSELQHSPPTMAVAIEHLDLDSLISPAVIS
ncbi:MAG: AAA family ATPase [Deltaproteobacteria bacterium]|nr:AAA family ATPase [Deltaproteobacteria bacterium]